MSAKTKFKPTSSGLTKVVHSPNLPPEAEDGNIEYKLKLISPTEHRFERLVTQLKWRLEEGQGLAIYKIGVEDNGTVVGLSYKEMDESISTLRRMAKELNAKFVSIQETIIGLRKVTNVTLRIDVPSLPQVEVRVVFVGPMDVGKSSLLGVLTQGETDNGHGSSRLNIFRHLHEIQSGRTSSISREVLGFGTDGMPLTYRVCRTTREICERAIKLITFIDLAGHPKYSKTTIYGITSNYPDYIILMIHAVSGIDAITKEYLELVTKYEVPLIVVINKADLPSPVILNKSVHTITNILKDYLLNPFICKNDHHLSNLAEETLSKDTTPIFVTSCVTGQGLDILYTFLRELSPTEEQKEKESIDNVFKINEIFPSSDDGVVIGGVLQSGQIEEGNKLILGPFENGSFFPINIVSIQKHRIACHKIISSESATLFINGAKSDQVRPGMLLCKTLTSSTNICQSFEAQIYIINLTTTIIYGFETTTYIGNVRQLCTIMNIESNRTIKNGDTVNISFRFTKYPEWVLPLSKIIFWDVRAKGLGYITKVNPILAY